MFLVTRGDRLYAGHSKRYKKADGSWSSTTHIVRCLGSKKQLLAKDPQAIEKLRASLRNETPYQIVTEQTQTYIRRYTKQGRCFAGFPILNYANYVLRPIWVDWLKIKQVTDTDRN